MMQAAHRCELLGDEEVSWNAEVHHRLLSRCLRPTRARGLVDFRAWYVGPISFSVNPVRGLTWPAQHNSQDLGSVPPVQSLPQELVDFAIQVDPSCLDASGAYPAAAAKARINDLYVRNPSRSINPTDFAPLSSRPIVVSIETKKAGGDIDNATLQLGTWHATQFRGLTATSATAAALRDSLDSAGPGDAAVNASSRPGESTAKSRHSAAGPGTEADSKEPPMRFLPSIIIHRHE